MRDSVSTLVSTIILVLALGACAVAPSPTPSMPRPASPPAASPTPTPSATPKATPSPAPIRPEVGAIAAGYQHTCTLTGLGGVRCWGENQGGTLGDGTEAGAAAAAATGVVDVVGLGGVVAAVAAGGWHSCALMVAGSVKCWGDNDYGQLGDGTTTDRTTPVDVAGLGPGVIASSAGQSHTCALTSGGGVMCWGDNPFGALGDGTTTNASNPTDVVGLSSGIRAIAAGGGHTCALKDDGGVTCWGDGQAADAATFHTSVPVDVPGLPGGITSIAAGLDTSCALTGNGEITCWGPNYGRQDDASIPARFYRVDTAALRGVPTAIGAGEASYCVLTDVGGVGCWGNDAYGQLGRGITSASARSVPVEVVGLGGVASGIAVGGMHACASTSVGVECWGADTNGQLADMTRCSSSSVPVLVAHGANAAAPPASTDPSGPPIGRIQYATGSMDVVLRTDVGPDVGVSELAGEEFSPGPEFTLFGDSTVIYRRADMPAPSGPKPIVRGSPFTVARLDPGQVQALLRFALDEGGLARACDRYETDDTDVSSSLTITIRAHEFVKRVTLIGESPLGPLLARLGGFDPGSGVATAVWAPDRHWGSLFEADSAIEIGLIPDPRDAGSAAWPWPELSPADFVGRDEGGWFGYPRRIMSADEASVLGLSDDGGVVQRVYLRGPEGKAIYYFSLWPMMPDEGG